MEIILLFINIIALFAFVVMAPLAALTLVCAAWDFYKTETDSRYKARKDLVVWSQGYHSYFPWKTRLLYGGVPGTWLLAVWLSGSPLFG